MEEVRARIVEMPKQCKILVNLDGKAIRSVLYSAVLQNILHVDCWPAKLWDPLWTDKAVTHAKIRVGIACKQSNKDEENGGLLMDF